MQREQAARRKEMDLQFAEERAAEQARLFESAAQELDSDPDTDVSPRGAYALPPAFSRSAPMDAQNAPVEQVQHVRMSVVVLLSSSRISFFVSSRFSFGAWKTRTAGCSCRPPRRCPTCARRT